MGALVEPNRGLIELYHRAEVLNTAIEQLQASGAHAVRVDAGEWTQETALLAIGQALNFPDFYGRSLDALADCLFDAVSGEYGYPAEATTKLLAIYQFDSYAAAHPKQAGQLLEILYDAAIMGLKLGKPFLVLLQSDDGTLTLPAVGAKSIGWNRAEWSNASRR